MDDKIEEYLRILYPEYDKLVKRDDANLEFKRAFIVENIEEIEKRYQELVNTEKSIEEEEESQKESNELIEEDNKEDIEATEEKQNEDENKEIKVVEENLDENIEVIEESQSEGNKQEDNLENAADNDELIDKEILKNVIKEIKINEYFKILHPEYDTLDKEEQYYVLDDKMLIRENIDAIDVYYLDCKMPGSGAEYFEMTDKNIIETALELFNQQEKNLTPQDIEQSLNSVKYAEFRQAITTIKEIAKEENEGKDTKQEE